MFVTMHPKSWKLVRHETKEAATTWAIEENKKDFGHPAFVLWDMTEAESKYVGTLWRECGCDFNPKNCWRV